jgi:hypothetical protein
MFASCISVKRNLCMQDGSGEIDMDEMCEIFCLMYTIQVREGSGPKILQMRESRVQTREIRAFTEKISP